MISLYIYIGLAKMFVQVFLKKKLFCPKLLGQPNICVYTYIIFFPTLFHSRLLQDIEYSSLCSSVNLSFSSISYFEMMAKEVMVKNQNFHIRPPI